MFCVAGLHCGELYALEHMCVAGTLNHFLVISFFFKILDHIYPGPYTELMFLATKNKNKTKFNVLVHFARYSRYDWAIVDGFHITDYCEYGGTSFSEYGGAVYITCNST